MKALWVIVAAAVLEASVASAAPALSEVTVYDDLCEASAAASLGDGYFAIGSDETNEIRIYRRKSPKPVGVVAVTDHDKSDLEDAAVIGDQVGYLIGAKAGRRLFNRPDSRLFKKEYVDKAEGFFARYGAKAIVLARFVPVVRTFVPTVAGVSRMNYPMFLRFNLIGGLIWGVGVTLLGYLFGNISYVKENFEIAILGVVVLSLAPILFEVLSHRRSAGQS